MFCDRCGKNVPELFETIAKPPAGRRYVYKLGTKGEHEIGTMDCPLPFNLCVGCMLQLFDTLHVEEPGNCPGCNRPLSDPDLSWVCAACLEDPAGFLPQIAVLEFHVARLRTAINDDDDDKTSDLVSQALAVLRSLRP